MGLARAGAASSRPAGAPGLPGPRHGRGALACARRRPGARLPTTLLASTAERLWALSPSTGRQRWERDLPGAPPTGAALLAGGPLALVEPGAVSGIDPRSGATVWRFTAPGASRTWAVSFGPVLVAGSDTGFLHGLDAEGRLLWRVRAPGPLLRAPAPWGGTCLALCETASGSALLAVDAATGVRRFEAPLELVPAGAPARWGSGWPSRGRWRETPP